MSFWKNIKQKMVRENKEEGIGISTPRLWVIMVEKIHYGNADTHEETGLVDVHGCLFEDFDEFVSMVKETQPKSVAENILYEGSFYSLENVDDAETKEFLKEYTVIYYSKGHEIDPTTFNCFFTKEAADAYISQNIHNLNKPIPVVLHMSDNLEMNQVFKEIWKNS